MDTGKTEAQDGRSFQAILEGFRKSFSSFQQPADLIILLTYCMPLLPPIRICIEAGIFRYLAASTRPVAASELVANLKGASKAADEEGSMQQEDFIVRNMSAVCALNLVDEIAPSTYLANALTKTLAEPGFDAGFRFLFDTTLGPHSTASHMVTWAKDHSYKAPMSSLDGPYQQARGIAGKTGFEHWVKDEPEHSSNLAALMQRIQQDRLNWSAWFPADVLFGDSESSKHDHDEHIFMVDVGGGLGHDLTSFASRYPDKKMHLHLQDLPEVIRETKMQKLDSRIEVSEHDFFQPQPIRGARIVSCSRQAIKASLV